MLSICLFFKSEKQTYGPHFELFIKKNYSRFAYHGYRLTPFSFVTYCLYTWRAKRVEQSTNTQFKIWRPFSLGLVLIIETNCITASSLRLGLSAVDSAAACKQQRKLYTRRKNYRKRKKKKKNTAATTTTTLWSADNRWTSPTCVHVSPSRITHIHTRLLNEFNQSVG